MTRLATLAITGLMLMSTVGCFRSRCAGYGGGCAPCGGACGAPAGGVYGAPTGGGGYYSPTGSSVNLGTQSNGPVAYGGYPAYSTPYPTTAFAPLDPLPTY